MAAYEGDSSEENMARLQELKISLQEAEQDLEEQLYDQYISDQEKLLDELYLEFETILNERLDNLELLISDMTDMINTNAATIGDTISAKADEVGISLSEAMNNIWNTSDFTGVKDGISNVITVYGDKFQESLTTTNSTLGNISKDVANMIGQLNKLAKTNVKSAASSSAAKKKESGSTTPAPTTTTPPKKNTGTTGSSSGDGKVKIGDKVKFVSGQYYYDSYGKSPLGSKYQGKEVYITNINTRGSHPYHISTGTKLGNGDLGWLKLNQISGYAVGKKDFLSNELAWTQENGQEFIVRPSDGAILTPLAKGDSVLSANASSNIWNMANNPSEFIKDNLGLGNVDTSHNSGGATNVEQNFDQIVFSLPNVKNYEQLLSEMKKDKNFERLINAMTVDQIAGKSSLAKNKAIR